jgi:hypothetical protein
MIGGEPFSPGEHGDCGRSAQPSVELAGNPLQTAQPSCTPVAIVSHPPSNKTIDPSSFADSVIVRLKFKKRRLWEAWFYSI